MRLLLDTHAFFWWLVEQERLSAKALAAIADPKNEVGVSIATAWEMAIKVGSGKWPEAASVLDTFEHQATAEEFRIISLTIKHVRTAGLIQSNHRDPFDRLLAAQAAIEGMKLISADPKLQELGSDIFW